MEALVHFLMHSLLCQGGNCLLRLVKEVEQVPGNIKTGPQSCPPPGLGASKGFDFKYLMEQLFFSLEAELSAKSSHRHICSEAPSCSPVISPCVVYCDYKTKLCQMQQCMTSSPGDTGAQG